MNSEYKIYTALCVLFAVMLVVGNIIYQKFVFLPVVFSYTFELSVGAIIYPITFLLSDIIAEFYGKAKANFCVRLAIAMNVLVAIVILVLDQLHATEWSKIDDVTFHKVFGLYSVSFIGSMVACYISQFIDIEIYLWIRRCTNGKWLWLRNNMSTAISLFIDTCIVIGFMRAFNILPTVHVWSLIMHSYLFKFVFTILSTPLFYIAVTFINNIIKDNSAFKH